MHRDCCRPLRLLLYPAGQRRGNTIGGDMGDQAIGHLCAVLARRPFALGQDALHLVHEAL
jgi:hypothetical protein